MTIVKSRTTLTSAIAAIGLSAAVFSSPVMAEKYDWIEKASGASTISFHAPKKCKNGKIWVEGSSTVNLIGVVCEKLKIHVEGASTLHIKGTKVDHMKVHIEGSSTVSMIGSYIKNLSGTVEGASTLNVPAGFVKHTSDWHVKGGSSYHVN